MATVTGLTKERMLEIESQSVVNGYVNNMGNLILVNHGGGAIDAGDVKGPQGIQGATGQSGIPGGTTAIRNSTFGVPSTDAEKATLANKSVSWYNIDTGVIETYLATTGTPGLNVNGTTKPSGWYHLPFYDRLPKGRIARVVTIPAKTGIAGTWTVLDLAPVSLVSGRVYRVTYKYNTLGSTADQAIAIELRKSATTDATEAGTAIDDTATDYLAPAAAQGRTSFYEFEFTATATETVNLKMCAVRATGSTTFEISGRKFSVVDLGAQ